MDGLGSSSVVDGLASSHAASLWDDRRTGQGDDLRRVTANEKRRHVSAKTVTTRVRVETFMIVESALARRNMEKEIPTRILAGGSLDVDNFGDLLFLLVTERYLNDAPITPSGPFGWDMEPILGKHVHAYAPLLERQSFDVV